MIAHALSYKAYAAPSFASRSKLAEGKWVKFSVAENGIYQITYDELRDMGFSDPNSVKIYGTGGHPMSEILDGSAIDDLQQIPIMHHGTKICFYANGPIKYKLYTATSLTRFTREINSYSQLGYYFITGDDNTLPLRLKISNISNSHNSQTIHTTSLDYMHHEQELTNPSQSGKNFLGEIMQGNTITVPYNIPGLCGDSAMMINVCAATKGDNLSYITADINDNNITFPSTSSRIYSSSDELNFYNFASPYALYRPSENESIPSSGNISVGINSVGILWSKLDYILLTYYHDNNMANAADNQLRMGYSGLSQYDKIAISNASSSTKVWNITNPLSPTIYLLSDSADLKIFMPEAKSGWTQFIAFDPDKELKSIVNYEEVNNQNIHGMLTPDMIIVTCNELIPQAKRIAQMHRDNDNMIVHVIDQQDIFNEFSSGTPDAMAIKLMNKMFYERNMTKFKYLLMFGAGSYDNRQLLSKRDCTTITYESDGSNDENQSFVTDDFFGFLDDNSGRQPASDMLRLGVGRIPSASLQEAKTDVDKLLNYVNNPDYGVWRNNALYVADHYDPDRNLHSLQAEGINTLMNNELSLGFNSNKIYITQFPNDPATEFAFEARKSMTDKLKEGQYFMTYVGHAGPRGLTKKQKLWTNHEARTVDYDFPSIVTTACCDVARFDGNQRGIMEIMFHKEKGGAIAMLTSTRSAYASGNDAINRAFLRALFCYNTKGYMATLGEAYMFCKQSFGKATNFNKMMFVLLGDPAMKVNYPKPLFKIKKINAYNVSNNTIVVSAMQRVSIEAQVYNEDGITVNTSFNGDATLTLYDMEKLERNDTTNGIITKIYYPRKKLTSVSGRVVNGVFKASVVVPRYIQSTSSYGCLSVYAHKDGTEEMVNGSFSKLMLQVYNPDSPNTIHDENPPAINEIYLGDKDAFAKGAIIPASTTLHIRATDDVSFNNQELSIGNSMKLILDDGKNTYPFIKSYTSLSNEGKTLEVDFPIELQFGHHTLDYTVFDAAGNASTQSLSFMVGPNAQVELSAMQQPAISEATFEMTSKMITQPQVTIKVLDNLGNLVWHTTTSQFPYTWDLKDDSNKRVPGGVYKYFGTYKEGNTYGGTDIKHLLIVEPTRTNY